MKKAIQWIIKFGITAGIFVLIFNPKVYGLDHRLIPVSLQEVWEEIRAIHIPTFVPWILAALAIKAFGMFSSIMRWNLLLKGQQILLPMRHLVGTFLVGRFFGMLLPSTIGLDAYRFYDVAKHTERVNESATVIAIEKLIGFIALSLLVFLTLPLGISILQTKLGINFGILVGILALLLLFIVASLIVLFNPTFIRRVQAIYLGVSGTGAAHGGARLVQSITGIVPALLRIAPWALIGAYAALIVILQFLGRPEGASQWFIIRENPKIAIAYLVGLGIIGAVGFLLVPRVAALASKFSLAALLEMATAYSGQRRLLVKATVWGFMVHLCTSLMYFATAMSIKTAALSISNILFVSPLMIYGTVLGPSIGGEGIRELVFVALLGAQVGPAKALLFSHLGFWVGETLSLAGIFIFLARPGDYRPKFVIQEMADLRARARGAPESVKAGGASE